MTITTSTSSSTNENDTKGSSTSIEYVNRYANESSQATLLQLVGSTLGRQLAVLLQNSNKDVPIHATSLFSCPLDEALVECHLQYSGNHFNDDDTVAQLHEYTLPPFGIYPSPHGRSRVGHLYVCHLQAFWQALAQTSGLTISLRKVRGINAHHIIEASFKAFSRAVRNLLDGTNTTDTIVSIYDTNSPNEQASIQLQRCASVQRTTKETGISIAVQFDAGKGGCDVQTGLTALDTFFTVLANHAKMSLQCQCHGDVWIDEHHTAEDVAIAVGQAIQQALGTKAGLNRMWSCTATCGTSKIQVVMDLSNRPYLTHNVDSLKAHEMVGDLPVEMLEHVLDSIVVNSRMTVHIVEVQQASEDHVHDTMNAIAMAFGQALLYCAMVDSRRAGKTASSKGTLSV